MDRQRHICPGQLPPRCHGSPSCTGSSVRKGKSLPESRSCQSLVGCRLLSVCHPLGQSCQGWGQDLATSKPRCHGQCGSAVASEAWTISSSLCPICAHGIAGRGTAKLSVQLSPLRLPGRCVFLGLMSSAGWEQAATWQRHPKNIQMSQEVLSGGVNLGLIQCWSGPWCCWPADSQRESHF